MLSGCACSESAVSFLFADLQAFDMLWCPAFKLLMYFVLLVLSALLRSNLLFSSASSYSCSFPLFSRLSLIHRIFLLLPCWSCSYVFPVESPYPCYLGICWTPAPERNQNQKPIVIKLPHGTWRLNTLFSNTQNVTQSWQFWCNWKAHPPRTPILSTTFAKVRNFSHCLRLTS